jgi:hypothetical protein
MQIAMKLLITFFLLLALSWFGFRMSEQPDMSNEMKQSTGLVKTYPGTGHPEIVIWPCSAEWAGQVKEGC